MNDDDTDIIPAIEGAAQNEQDNDISIAAGGAAIAGFGDVMNALLRYITNVLMTHLFVPGVYGSFNEVYTAMIILGWVAKWGLDGVLICLLPAYRVKGQRDLIGGLTRFSVWVTLISGVCIGGLLLVFARSIAQAFYHNLSYTPFLQYSAPLVPLAALQLVLAAGLQGFKAVKWKIYVDRLSQPVITSLVLIIFCLCGWRNQALSFSVIFGYLVSVVLGQICMRSVVRRYTKKSACRYSSAVWTKTAAPMIFNGLIYGVLNSADVLFLSVFATSVQAAIYIAADRVSSFVAMPLFALNIIFSPMIAEYYVSNDKQQLEKMLKLITRWSLSLSLPIFLACLAFHDAILAIFGPQYVAGSVALIVICLGNLINAGTGSILQLLVMTGRLRLVSVNSIMIILVNIGLSFLLVPRWNIFGAALAASLAVVMLNALCLVEVYWIMKIHPYRWDTGKPLFAGGLAYLSAMLLLHLVPAGFHYAQIVQLSLLLPFVLIYGIVLTLLRFDKDDRLAFAAIVNRFVRKPSVHAI